MILPDVNVLVYALRPETEHYAQSREWLTSVVNGPGVFGISPQVLCSVVRLVTTRRIFPFPTLPAEAFEFCNTLLEHPQCQTVGPGKRHWRIFEDLCRTADAKGNLVTGAWFAALAIESGCEWITYDRDYARFPGLRWRVPG